MTHPLSPSLQSLILHILVAVILIKPSWFDPFQFIFKQDLTLQVIAQRSMRVDVLGLPELEAYMARESPQVIPDKLKRKVTGRKKTSEKTAHETRESRRDIIRKMRQRLGNILQEGADVAPSVSVVGTMYEGDPFWLDMKDHILSQWNIPSSFKEKDIAVTYKLKLLNSGEIIEVTLVKPSTTPEYDSFVKDFVQNQLQITIPMPPRFYQMLKEDGINVEFIP